MSNRYQVLPYPTADGASGPQGTRLFSADELRQYARETGPAPDGRASVHAPVLEGVNGRGEGVRFKLSAGRQTIGRSPNNDIVVDNASVSAEHAWIIGQRSEFVVMNTLSTNGTFVNGKRIHEVALHHNDHIRFGQAEFVFLTREHGARAPVRVYGMVGGAAVLVGLAALAWWLI